MNLSPSRRATYITVAALCMVATFPGRTHGLGFITESVLHDLNIDRTLYSYYNLVATLAGALFCIPIGAWLDRIGCRKTLSIVLAMLGVSVLAMSAVQSKLPFFVCLLLTRGFGQSALSVASITLISKYFPKTKLGPAMGIYSVLTSVFFVGAFGAMGAALEHLQPCTIGELVVPVWRMAWGGIGVMLLAFFVPLILLCVRRHHALPVADEGEVAAPLEEEAGVPFAQAIRSSAFWIFGLSIAFYGLVSSGIALHNEDILLERGFDTQTYHLLMVLAVPFGLLSNIGIGYLARRVRIKRLLVYCLLFTAVTKLLFPVVQTPLQVYAYTAIFALSGGGLSVLFFIAWADLFGTREVGRIQGLAQMLSVFASALGPIFFAYSKEWTGSYTPAFYISGGMCLVFAVAAAVNLRFKI